MIDVIFYLAWVLTILISGGIIPIGVWTVYRIGNQLLRKQEIKKYNSIGYLALLNFGLSLLFFGVICWLAPSVTPAVFFFYTSIIIIDAVYVGLATIFLCLFLWTWVAQRLQFNSFHVILAIRIVISPIIFIDVFWGLAILLILEGIDIFFYRKELGLSLNPIYSSKQEKLEYDKYEKIADISNMSVMVFYAMIFWQNPLFLFLFLFRLFGQAIWYIKPDDRIFVIFPNVFMNLFIMEAFIRTFLPASVIFYETYFLFFLFVLVVYTIITEYFIHIFTWRISKIMIGKYILLGIITVWIAGFIGVEQYHITIGPFPSEFLPFVLVWGVVVYLAFIMYVIVYKVVTNDADIWIKWRDILREKVGGEYKGNTKKSWVIILTNYGTRITISIIFLLFVPYSFLSMIIYLVIVETMDTTWDSAFTVNLPMKQRNLSFLLDDTADWVGRTIFFLPFITSIWWMPVFIGYHFLLIGVRIFTPKGRWLKIAGLSILYITPFYLYYPQLFGIACFVAYVLYTSFYWGYFMGKEKISE